MSDPDDFKPLSDTELHAIAPELGHRAALLFSIVRLKMVRQPETEKERALAQQLAELFPDHYRLH